MFPVRYELNFYTLPRRNSVEGVEYLHRSLANRRRRRKGNPVPGRYKYGDLALQVGGVSNLRQ
jgi:hypothetical protein